MTEIMNIKLFALAAVSIAFTACTNDESLNLDNEPVKAVINATIVDAFKTRAYEHTIGMLQAILRRTKKTSTTTHLRMWRSPPTILGKRN